VEKKRAGMTRNGLSLGSAVLALLVCTACNPHFEPTAIRFDVAGNALDAHDGALRRFDGTYYIYGTSYDCGFEWFNGGRFCGFKVYSSPDLVHFTDKGLLFDPADWQKICVGNLIGCYRPHIIKNPNTNRYVLWFNSYENAGGYHVMESSEPDRGFMEVGIPRLAVNAGPEVSKNGDENLFIDNDGTGYVIYTDVNGHYDQIIERLTPDYHNGTGQYVRLNLFKTEAPSLFRRGDRYYVTVSDPNCAYCSGTGASYLTSLDPLSGWSSAMKFSDSSCGGQPADTSLLSTDFGDIYLFQSDLWTGDRNEALANVFWGPVQFDESGALRTLNCSPSAPFIERAGLLPPPGADIGSGYLGFHAVSDVGAAVRAQGFRAGRTGTLTLVSFAAYQYDRPDGPLTTTLSRLDESTHSELEVASQTWLPAQIGWSPRMVSWSLNIPVLAGQHYLLRMQATLSHGSYGSLYSETGSDADAVAQWTDSKGTQRGGMIKFYTVIQ